VKNEKNNPIGDDLNPNLKEAIKKKKTLKNDTKDLDAQLKDLNNSVTFLLRKISNSGKSISKKYSVLESYKALAYLMMIASTGFFIYAIVQFGDAPKAARKMLENAMITSTVSYVISMFSLFCLTKIIDFLFDLDKKTNL